MYNRRYDKAFLMLRQETAGYGMGQRTPWGSCVMELKNGGGRLMLTVQGLRPLRRGHYSVYAMGGEGEGQENFFCGTFTPDGSGHGELKWDFQPDHMGRGRLLVEDLHTIGVLAEEGDTYSVPLTGSFGEKKQWRPYFQRERDTLEDVAEESVLVAAEAAVLERPAPVEIPPMVVNFPPRVTEQAAEEGTEESYHGSFRGLLEKFRRELGDLEEAEVFSAEDMHHITQGKPKTLEAQSLGAVVEDAMAVVADVRQGVAVVGAVVEAAQEIADVMEEIEDFVEEVAEEVIQEGTEDVTKEVLKDVADHVSEEQIQDVMKEEHPLGKVFAQNTDIYPFGEERWQCVSLKELVFLPEAPLAWQKDFFFLMPMSKYHHFIWKDQPKGFVLGVPGYDTKKEREEAAMRGFTRFEKMEDGDLGYWLWEKK